MNHNITNRSNFLKIRPDFLVCLFFVISILAVYWQMRNYDFINYDDNLYVTVNPYVQSGLNLKSIAWAFTSTHASNWHPVTWLSHMLDCRLYGMNPGQHHLTNVLFHILNTLLLFFVFKRMTGELWPSGFIAALFALHPLHVESVAWLAERKDVLSTFFWMLTMWSYVRYVERSEFGRCLPVLLFFILGLMAKPMLVTLPFVLLLLDCWPLKRFHLVTSGDGSHCGPGSFYLGMVWEKTPLFLLSGASCVVTYIAQKSSGAVSSLAVIPFHVRIHNAIVSYVSYIGKMIWPYKLAILYPYPKSMILWQVAGAGVLLAVISVVVFRMVKTKPYFAVGWFWFLGTLVPVSGLVQVGSQAMADRYTYVPLIGLFIIIAWGVPDILAKWRYKKNILAISALFVLSAVMICTMFQVRNWRNSITVFQHAVDVTENNYVAYEKLGEALAAVGQIDLAIKHYSEALRIRPDFMSTHLSMGIALREKGNYDEAIRHFLEALRINPDNAMVHNNLGVVLARKGNDKEAVSQFYEAIRIDPDYAGAYYNLGKIFENQGKFEDAILFYRKTLHFNPNMTQTLYNLSWILATHKHKKIRNGQEAVKFAKSLSKITQYKQALALDSLAAAYAEVGRFDDAVLTAKKALKLALDQGPEELVLGLKKRLQLYEEGFPYRQRQ
jgi:tetratricopeptide (TPR) repeat protein